jgi:ribose 5-phosphate isomerase A
LSDVMSLYATQDEKKQAAAKAALKHLPKVAF